MNWLKKFFKRRSTRKAEMVVRLKEILPVKICASRMTKHRGALVTSETYSKVDPFSSQHARLEVIKILAEELI